ncbi:putative CRISPR-associated protein cas8c/csd1, subtype I-c/dvulg [Desulfosarcina cetonica]|uniref:type I-C CRISPR-associated protein Cas8c/Csd1 n=1 Tax=Desulfosarcina cetonica TaxID=90730 RepID=UPI0006CFD2D1|nr:type I-C CRISPR-associated protein Cas8c/Csd1 [Desulfosarcina cetonica]VTR65486.1 putative CRISPR-associated protein cas8c/csd1, subtype I-c/dvulg [Desulfosarcina cetonica]
MGVWQNLANSYVQNAEELKPTYPLSTTSISNKTDFIAVIVIDGNGKFLRADKIEKQSNMSRNDSGNPLVNITIPVTENSLGRAGKVAWNLPHPLFDQFGYLKGKGRKFESYLANLKAFAESEFATEQVKAIYRYVAKGTVAADLTGMKPAEKTNIVFQVEIPNHSPAKVWEDETVFDGWHKYCSSKISDTALDYISGQEQAIATFHPKKISNRSGNAKLISANDDQNYTFRGKFSNSSQALSIGYETTQQAHQFLRYLINDRGYYCGEQVILSFTIDSTENTLPPPLQDTKSIWDMMQESQKKTDSDTQIALRAETGFDYANALKQAFAGLKYRKVLAHHTKTAVLALDAATTGRLSITFYRELERSEYLKKISDWHSGCKWKLQFWDKESKKYVRYVGAPSVDKIIEVVYGKPRSGKDESYTKIKKAARERLLRCIFDGEKIPLDYVNAAVRRASNPMGTAQEGNFERGGFTQIVSVACALVRKYYQQHNGEGYQLSIEADRKDRDYLYGRLLGAADKLEEYALYKKEKGRIVTAAIRHMQAFAQRPFRTWQTIHGCLNPYIQTVKGSYAFNEIQAVMNRFEPGDYEKDFPLNGSYLIGYYHERDHIDTLAGKTSNTRQSTDGTETEENND